MARRKNSGLPPAARMILLPLVGLALIGYGVYSFMTGGELSELDAQGTRAAAEVIDTRIEERRKRRESGTDRRSTDYFITIRFTTPDRGTVVSEREVNSKTHRMFKGASASTPMPTEVVYNPDDTTSWYEVNEIKTRTASSEWQGYTMPLIGLIVIVVGIYSFFEWRRENKPAATA